MAHKVVIIGGGFAGLHAVRTLANRDVEVVLIDRRNHHTFQPLLYQVASGVLSPGQIAKPLRNILKGAKNVEVVLGEVTGIDAAGREVSLASGDRISYNTLVMAAGATHAYFGHDEWERFAPGLKSIEDATELRRRILLAFERCESAAYFHADKAPPLGFAVIGGGPTGVELAGAIADIAKRALYREYRTIDTRRARVALFEGGPRLLQAFDPSLSTAAKRQLEELGVEVHLDSRVERVEEHSISTATETFEAQVIIWASGVQASGLGALLGVAVDRAGRVPVRPDLTIEGHPEIFVLGDAAACKDAHGVLVPALGSAAMQEGAHTGHNILRRLRGQELLPFVYKDKGTMATIGKNRAIAQIGKSKMTGIVAWLLWSLVHVFLLIGFRNRLRVAMEWVWVYLRNSPSALLITEPSSKKDRV